MKNILSTLLVLVLFLACGPKDKADNKPAYKIPVYAWTGGPNEESDQEILQKFQKFKENGIDGLMYNGGQDPATYKRVGKIAKEVGMEFHTWIPTMNQTPNAKLTADLYAINGKGESAFDKPAYVSYYKFLCPNKPEVFQFLSEMYGSIADVEEVDGIHLDYIRFPDVILAPGLWEKYGLVQDKEYPAYDYCYCDTCVEGFKEKTGINIKDLEDPSSSDEWKQYRYDLITNLVNKLTTVIHAKNKKINAAVFPGPSLAKKMVRQEWNEWNLDAFYPMNYNDFYLEGSKWVGEMTKESVNTLNDGRPVYSGLFICPDPAKKKIEPDPENHGLLPEELGDAIAESMKNGAAGICLFTPGRMTDEHWVEFKKAIYKKYE